MWMMHTFWLASVLLRFQNSVAAWECFERSVARVCAEPWCIVGSPPAQALTAVLCGDLRVPEPLKGGGVCVCGERERERERVLSEDEDFLKKLSVAKA